MNSNIDKLFTIEEVAKILRVSGRSVTRYIESGKLKASKMGLGGIKESDLHAFLEETSNSANKKNEINRFMQNHTSKTKVQII